MLKTLSCVVPTETKQLSGLIDTLVFALDAPVVLIKGVDEKFPLVQERILNLLESDKTAQMLKHLITTEWLDQIILQYNLVYGFKEQKSVSQVADIYNRLIHNNDTSVGNARKIIKKLGSDAVKLGVTVFSEQILFARRL